MQFESASENVTLKQSYDKLSFDSSNILMRDSQIGKRLIISE